MNEPRYAGFGVRLAAVAIDIVVLSPFIIAGAIAETSAESAASATARLVGAAVSLVCGVAVMAYYIYFHALRGQTPGKRKMRIRVVTASALGAITARQAFARSAVDVIVWLIGFASWMTVMNALPLGQEAPETSNWSLDVILETSWTMLEIVVLLANVRSRAVHDFIAGTAVVRTT
ncbi:MAG TPA: RDD family protein [Bdellovibrionota bacterium]|nr:RDD family protein [Bdellovibrionota bacterium]